MSLIALYSKGGGRGGLGVDGCCDVCDWFMSGSLSSFISRVEEKLRLPIIFSPRGITANIVDRCAVRCTLSKT
jgi:hypothetical protein